MSPDQMSDRQLEGMIHYHEKAVMFYESLPNSPASLIRDTQKTADKYRNELKRRETGAAS